MAERIRGVDHVGAATELLGVRGAGEEVAHQGLARWNQLVREDIPGTGLEAALAHQTAQRVAAVGAKAEVVLGEHGLPIEQETPKARLRLETSHDIVHRRNQPRGERGSWQVPLTIPVGVGG